MHLTPTHPILYRLLRTLEGATAFSLLFLLFVLSLFFLGNSQEFLDSSQTLLLDILRFVSLVCGLVGLYYSVGLVAWMVSRRKFVFWRTILASAAVVLGTALSFGVNFVLVLLGPVTGG
ncbi:MAG TPA: hypothetical protein VMW87_10360 [Spirochaetia bacterium]|nr:hypothetical protein [Spirochaetia bacterium]